MNITISAKSSSGEPYLVEFVRQEGKLSVSCNCRAGIFGKHCKHKWQLLSGNESMLAIEGENDKLRQVRQWSVDSNSDQLFDEINALKKEVQELKNRIREGKKEIEQKMKQGF